MQRESIERLLKKDKEQVKLAKSQIEEGVHLFQSMYSLMLFMSQTIG